MEVTKETRAVLLGHTNGDITTHYSAPEIQELINATNKLNEAKDRGITLIRVGSRHSRGKKNYSPKTHGI